MTDEPQRADAREEDGEVDPGPLQQAVRAVFGELEHALEEFAQTGAIAFDELARSIALSLASIAIDALFSPLESILKGEGEDTASDTLSNLLPGAVARGEGGGFSPGEFGGGFLPGLGPCVKVTINAYGSPLGAVRQSESQIAAAVARAVRRGVMKL